MNQKKLNGNKTRAQKRAKPYQPTPHEGVPLEGHLAQKKENPSAPRLIVRANDGAGDIFLDHPEPAVASGLLMEALGTRDWDFLDGFVLQLANVANQGPKVDERGLNFVLSMVKGVEPRDQVEAMLAAQMAAVHMATMTFARKLAHVENIPQQDSAERALNKLARTFASQVEALKRYRSRGDQTVRVEHVTVNQGGQAIVGNVKHGGGGDRDEGG